MYDTLQSIQNTRFLTHTKRSNHITPTLAVRHWLPVSFRIDFKICMVGLLPISVTYSLHMSLIAA